MRQVQISPRTHKKEIIVKSHKRVYVPEQEGLTTRIYSTQSTSHEECEERDLRRLWGGKKTNMELVHKALSMGGKCMLNKRTISKC